MPDAHIRAVHCSPDAPTVTVSLGDTTQRISYGEVTDYVTVPSGATEVTVESTDGDQRGPSMRTAPRLDADSSQTVLIAGAAQRNSLQAITLEDDAANVRSHRAKLRFVNATHGSPALDFRFAEPTVRGEEVLSREIAFGQNGIYRTIDAGTHRFDFGVDTDEGYRRVLTGEKTFEGGRTYTVVAMGRAESEEYEALWLEDALVEAPSK